MSRIPAPLSAYSDVQPLWEAAHTRGGIVHVCTSPARARELVNRLCTYRMRDRATTPDGVSLYDGFVVKNPKKGCNVVIERRATVFEGTTYTLDNEPVDMQAILKQIRDFDNYKADEYLRGLGVDTSGLNPDAPLSLDETC